MKKLIKFITVLKIITLDNKQWQFSIWSHKFLKFKLYKVTSSFNVVVFNTNFTKRTKVFSTPFVATTLIFVTKTIIPCFIQNMQNSIQNIKMKFSCWFFIWFYFFKNLKMNRNLYLPFLTSLKSLTKINKIYIITLLNNYLRYTITFFYYIVIVRKIKK